MSVDWKGLSHDILKQIFAFCDKDGLTRCARTCKNWKDPSLDLLWFDLRIEDFEHIFAILAPLLPVAGQPHNGVTRLRFSRRITHRDWRRFIPYASRVRHVDGFHRDEDYRILSETAFAELLMTRPAKTPLFPRARRFEVDGDLIPYFPGLKVFLNLLHEDLREFTLNISEESPDEIVKFFEEVVWRSPNITNLDIETSLNDFNEDMKNSLISSISALRRLTTVAIYPGLLTAQLFSALQQLPDLQEVRDFFSDSLSRAARITNETLPHTIPSNAFPRLTRLTLHCSFAELYRYLSLGKGFAPRLRHLDIGVVSKFKPANLRIALLKIAETFPLLEHLRIIQTDCPSALVVERDPTGSKESLNRRSLNPLTRLRSLHTFILRCDEVVSMANDELCAILSQCTSLKYLILNHEPLALPTTELTLDVLPMLAQKCPQLLQLCLFVDTDVEDAETVTSHTFEKMTSIDFGISPVHDKRVITKLLAQVLPEECILMSNPAHTSDIEALLVSPEDRKTREERRKEWAEISQWIPVLFDFYYLYEEINSTTTSEVAVQVG
ncbi:hypothetical protein SCHPADRAFT_996698 [Schizopora paradoxa]|uniref:F-box domain-containing protein n=1 Tax=Schizopora paradoxa TaxID=27342 RepID=A0A0H2RXM0_9AGAM|nr:hypothetical protein SCHPADRAFT_996698 [Schizopora paradoxa]